MANEMGQIAGADRRAGQITHGELEAKASSKRELYRLLQSECGIYLSSYDTTTVSLSYFSSFTI